MKLKKTTFVIDKTKKRKTFSIDETEKENNCN